MFAGCRCPRCAETTLVVADVEGRKALGCPHCSGAFVGAELGLRLLAVLSPHVPPLRAGSPVVPCPVCRQAMRRVVAADLDVDTCKAHGVWLDAGDLRQLVGAVAKALGKPVPAAFRTVEAAASPVPVGSPASPPSPPSNPVRGGYERSGLDVAADVAAGVAGAVLNPVEAVADVVLFPFRVVGLLSELVD